jgi:hypothetical protein
VLETAHPALPPHRRDLAQNTKTHDATAGAVTDPTGATRSLLLGRYDTTGQLQYIGRTTTLPPDRWPQRGRPAVAVRSRASMERMDVPCRVGSSNVLDVVLMQPDVVVEVSGDLARDAAGRWRHPMRGHRVRTDISPEEVPRMASPH